MELITVSSRGQIVLPKAIREALNLSAGTRLILDIEGHNIVLSKEPAWKKLEGSVKAEPGKPSLTDILLEERRKDREREDRKARA
jgi:antitoxin PrlF